MSFALQGILNYFSGSWNANSVSAKAIEPQKEMQVATQVLTPKQQSPMDSERANRERHFFRSIILNRMPIFNVRIGFSDSLPVIVHPTISAPFLEQLRRERAAIAATKFSDSEEDSSSSSSSTTSSVSDENSSSSGSGWVIPRTADNSEVSVVPAAVTEDASVASDESSEEFFWDTTYKRQDDLNAEEASVASSTVIGIAPNPDDFSDTTIIGEDPDSPLAGVAEDEKSVDARTQYESIDLRKADSKSVRTVDSKNKTPWKKIAATIVLISGAIIASVVLMPVITPVGSGIIAGVALAYGVDKLRELWIDSHPKAASAA